jgi:hypothetical protein
MTSNTPPANSPFELVTADSPEWMHTIKQLALDGILTEASRPDDIIEHIRDDETLREHCTSLLLEFRDVEAVTGQLCAQMRAIARTYSGRRKAMLAALLSQTAK